MRNKCKDVVGYEKWYQVSSDGKVYSKPRMKRIGGGRYIVQPSRELKPLDNGRGYLSVMLYNERRGKRAYVHRIVAEAFIPNPKALPQVNHKDENKANNSAENLEWCDAKYNLTYGTHTSRVQKANSKTVLQINIDGEVVAEFISAMEAMRKTGIKQGSISKCCKGERDTAGGFKWQLKEEAALKESTLHPCETCRYAGNSVEPCTWCVYCGGDKDAPSYWRAKE